MKRLEQIQFGTFLLTVASIAINWMAGFWATVAFALVSLVRMIVTVCQTKTLSSLPNPALGPRMRWGLVTMVIYWILILLSMAYTDDSATGWALVSMKASILFFPIAFLLTDTSYMTSKHLRVIGNTLVASLLLVFVYRIGVGIVKVTEGATIEEVTGLHFDPRHHAYTALYLTTALLFIHYELLSHWHSLPKWHRCTLTIAFPLLIVYVILVNSRAGMLTLYAIELFVVIHYALTQHNWPKAILLAVLLGGYTVGMEVVIPGHDNRLSTTIGDLSSDGRLEEYKAGVETWLDSPVIGHGAGDYRQKLLDRFEKNGFLEGVENQYNAHNQYIETLLCTGLIGLLVLLIWMLWPTLQAAQMTRKKEGKTKNQDRNVFWLIVMLTFCVMLGCLFESMLERQMGLLFIGALTAVMTLVVAGRRGQGD